MVFNVTVLLYSRYFLSRGKHFDVKMFSSFQHGNRIIDRDTESCQSSQLKCAGKGCNEYARCTAGTSCIPRHELVKSPGSILR